MSSLKLNIVDARGLSCPQPVLLVKKSMEKYPGGFQVLVDNTTALNNITRFAGSSGYKVETVNQDGDYLLPLQK